MKEVIDKKTKFLLSARMAVDQPQLSKLTERLIKCLLEVEGSRAMLEDLNSASTATRKAVLAKSKMGAGDTKAFLQQNIQKFEMLGKFYRLCSDTMADFLASEFAAQYHEKTGKALLSLANEYDKPDMKKRAQIMKKVQSMREGFLILLGERAGKKFATQEGKRKYFIDLLEKNSAKK